jgi:hypothetical protein
MSIRTARSYGRKRHRPSCADGKHQPEPLAEEDLEGPIRAPCRRCGVTLVKVLRRSWIFSGELG